MGRGLSRVKRVRKARPAKISVTVFGAKVDHPAQRETVERGEGASCPESHREPIDVSDFWGPKLVPQHGPLFRQLSSSEKEDLVRLHQNLGHPDPARFVKLLQEQGADERIIRGASQMQCSTCAERRTAPLSARPGRIHEDLDFNDRVGADGAYWTGRNGRVYHFMHFIDESTLYHVGTRCGRTVDEQIRAFEESWLHWAGPCKTLYLDPAGEYVSDAWATRLQRDDIKVSMCATQSHWQNGRCERHGAIVKDMLSRIDHEQPIENEDDFRVCLRHVFAAKNALSRVRGFTPEQALLGKSKPLPASLVSDDSAASHALAESSCPEGLRFRQDLCRREQARRSFIAADNSSAFRRALLRRTRPFRGTYTKGDWVLYWRSLAGNSRASRGRWHGPAQIVVVEDRVLWLSHVGRLIRASPEQVRPTSMREYQELPRDPSGRVIPDELRPVTGPRAVIELDELPDIGDIPDVEMPPVSSAPLTPVMQPEREVSPGVSDLPLAEPAEPSADASEVPVPDLSSDDELFGDVLFEEACGRVGEQGYEITIRDVPTSCLSDDSPSDPIPWPAYLITGAKKQRVELRWKDLNAEDQQLFLAAKNKEIKAWLDHGTVKRVCKGTLDPASIMRCRWILTWKDPEVPGGPRRAKARLVVLGFTDPGLSYVPNDAPTLSKDGRMLVLQTVSSNHWNLVNFDVSTAFLKGEGDGRILGLDAPAEMAQGLSMKPGDQCQLVGGAYGRIDGPYLWYKAFRKTLESLGFIAAPFDGCVFALVSENPEGQPQVHGMLGIHVDDGLGGGDSHFTNTLKKLQEKYSFGAYHEGEFTFCGVQYTQWPDFSIELSQARYLEKIEPLSIPKHRRSDPSAVVTEEERQGLRQVCGSLQYAAVHTRPDLAAKCGELQSVVPVATVGDLLLANKVVYEAKTHHVSLTIVAIPPTEVTFCGFSDASFATSKSQSSRQGTLIFATNARLLDNKVAVICPMAWASKKIARVVRSTLSAEAVSLSATLDRLSWIRLFWEWIRNPAIDLTQPDKILASSPQAAVATDCKSVYDIATRTSTPSCEEFRTTLECLLIRERLKEGCRLRWVASKAMLADTLTKVMDGHALRHCLKEGRYALFDEGSVLKERSDRRSQLEWVQRNGVPEQVS